MSLLQNTQELLRRQQSEGKSLAEIHRSLGDAVDRNWFYKFAAGDIGNPGVKHIQALHDQLKKLARKAS